MSSGIPEEYRLESLRAAILLLPDVNRVALYHLMTFLSKVASYSQKNQVILQIHRLISVIVIIIIIIIIVIVMTLNCQHRVIFLLRHRALGRLLLKCRIITTTYSSSSHNRTMVLSLVRRCRVHHFSFSAIAIQCLMAKRSMDS